MPVLSIITVTQNAEDHLRLTINSMHNQSGIRNNEIEWILVDGGSDDATVSIASSSGLFTKVISEPDSGIYDAMNKGASVAIGTWLHFLNAGDAFSTELSLRRILDELETSSSSERKFVVSGAQNLRNMRRSPIRIPSLPHIWWYHMIGFQPHCHQACWFDRNTFETIGGYDASYRVAADFDLILKFGILSAPIEISEILIDYLGGGISEGNPTIKSDLFRIRSDRLGMPMTVNLGISVIAIIRRQLKRSGSYVKGFLRKNRE